MHLTETLFTEEELKARVKELGAQITKDYSGDDVDLVVVGVLKGAFIFMADLIREIKVPVEVDFMSVSSYGSSTKSSGVVRLLKDLDHAIANKDVLIVEDIVDSGVTLTWLKNNLLSRNPKSVKICTCFDKPSRRRVELIPDYCGFEIPDKFLVGYGLDYIEHGREFPFVAVVDPDK